MSGFIESDEETGISEMLEELDIDESSELSERRFRPLRTKVPTGQGLYKSRPTTSHVTQVQLQAALARVGGQIKTNAEATKALTTRVNTANSRIDSEVAARKKEDAALKKQLSSGKMMSLLPLLLTSQPKIKEIEFEGGELNNKRTVKNATFEKQDNMLPLLLLLGSGGLGGDSKDGGSDDSMMMLVLVMMMSK